MHHFDDLDSVNSTLRHLIDRDPPLAKLLVRQPGTKEARYTQLLSNDATAPTESALDSPPPSAKSVLAFPQAAKATAPTPSAIDRMIDLEQKVSALQQEIADLKQQLANFRRQFE
jgi:uncharacterized protein YceH (UPF0502 family)